MLALPWFRHWVFLLPAIMLAYPPHARADRVDIDDPTLLGPLLHRDFILDGNELETTIAEVRYAGGVYSYIYAVSTNPYVPGTACCEAGIVSFSVTGHPLEERWGAIRSSDTFWSGRPDLPGTTRAVVSIAPIDDGFLVVPEPGGGQFTVMYVQSRRRPSRDGRFTYTGLVYDWDRGGLLRIESLERDDVLVPTPEPASIVLFGLGLAGLAVRRRRRSRQAAVTGTPPAAAAGG